MRIKTTREVMEELDFLKSKLLLENNAQTLKIAIAYGLYKDYDCSQEVVENGFEIDTNTLFGEDEKIYHFLIQKKYPNLPYRKSLTRLIDFGIHQLIIDLRYAKNDTSKFILKILEERCI